jgi:hypothetical protein
MLLKEMCNYKKLSGDETKSQLVEMPNPDQKPIGGL